VGAAQIVLLGLTKSGKSSLLTALTNAKVEISSSPYTTREPVPGIMNYQDIQIQIIEAPALMEGSADGRAWGLQTLGVARNADGLILVIDLSQDPVKQLSTILEIERKFMGAGLRITVMGRLVDCNFKDVEELLKSYRVTDAFVKVSGEATLGEIEDAIYESTVYKPAVVIANKVDLKGADGNLKLLKADVRNKLPIIAASCANRTGLEKLGETLFNTLNIMRIYTKEPNEREFSNNPFILKKGSTIYDLARNIHSDFKENFNFARVWSKRLRFSPQKVGATFILQDGDVVEIHLK
jgi:small GTP-binding protein